MLQKKQLKRKKSSVIIIIVICVLIYFGVGFLKKVNFNSNLNVGDPVDSLHHVYVYFNGGVGHTGKRNVTTDGYNLGFQYQCVEFVKRYYYEYLHHKMPDSYGNAKDFFEQEVADGEKNHKRGLIQFTNSSRSKPMPDDLVVFDGTLLNRYGHVAIVLKVSKEEVEIIQQNPGPFGSSRAIIPLTKKEGKWLMVDDHLLGWLRLDSLAADYHK